MYGLKIPILISEDKTIGKETEPTHLNTKSELHGESSPKLLINYGLVEPVIQQLR